MTNSERIDILDSIIDQAKFLKRILDGPVRKKEEIVTELNILRQFVSLLKD